MTVSSLLFIAALGLVNADGNITSYNLQYDPAHSCEVNPLAAPLAEGYSHYLNTAAVDAGLILAHDKLKAEHPGLEDVLTIGVFTTEYFMLRTWSNAKDDIGFEIGLSEAEFLITSSVFNIKF